MKKFIALCMFIFVLIAGCGSTSNSKPINKDFLEGTWKSGDSTYVFKGDELTTTSKGNKREPEPMHYTMVYSDDSPKFTITQSSGKSDVSGEMEFTKLNDNEIRLENSHIYYKGELTTSASDAGVKPHVFTRQGSGFFAKAWQGIKSIVVLAFLAFIAVIIFRYIKAAHFSKGKNNE